MTTIYDVWAHYSPIAFSLLWATILGGLIGLERQWRQRLAGTRTNALVALGACSFTLFSQLMPHQGADSVARVAAQVVSGIGFLGAGVIMRDGFTVRGLTTAATLWCASAVGVLVGADLVGVAIMTSLVVLGVNLFFRPISRAIDIKTRRSDMRDVVVVRIICDPSLEKVIRLSIHQWADLVHAQWVFWASEPKPPSVELLIKLTGLDPSDPQYHKMMQLLNSLDGVKQVSFDLEKHVIKDEG